MPKFAYAKSEAGFNAIDQTSAANVNKVYFNAPTQEIWCKGIRFGLGKISWGGYLIIRYLLRLVK